MTQKKLNDRINRAKWLLENAKHAAMATVNEDGSPHNTPYFFMASDDLSELYWGSYPDSLHSKNILRTGQLFVVLYEADKGGGLYIKCQNGRIAEGGKELERALTKHNELRMKFSSKDPISINYYKLPNPQRMWIADTVTFWVNYGDRGKDGHLIQDKRHEVSRKLLSD